MMYTNSDAARERKSSRAAIFVDYENIYRSLSESSHSRPDELISEMIDALQKSLRLDRDARMAVSRAYADFTSLHGETIQRLYLQGVEPRFVPGSLQANAVEIQLCVDAMDLLHHRPDIETFVLLTGHRTYLPLIQHVKRYGRGVMVVALEEPKAFEHVQHMEGEWFFDARDLLSSTNRRVLNGAPKAALRAPHSGNGVDVRRSAPKFTEIEDPVLLRALAIIQRHFGQYDEVYLTPLLRKMSEMLDDHRYDPKTIVSDLEDYHAVRLEKRQGFPHDYTVLIVEHDHPDVVRIRTDEAERLTGYGYDDYAERGDDDEDYYDGDDDYDFEDDVEREASSPRGTSFETDDDTERRYGGSNE